MPSLKSNEAPPAPAFLNVNQVAAQLSCSLTTVYELIQNGSLTAFRIGVNDGCLRIRPEDLAAYLESCRTTTEPAAPSFPPVRDRVAEGIAARQKREAGPKNRRGRPRKVAK